MSSPIRPVTAANPLHLAQFARRSWWAERSVGDASHQQLEPLVERWNHARTAAGLAPTYLHVHVGVLLHSYLNVDDWVFAVARAFAAADRRYLADVWPPGSPATKEWVEVGPANDPDVVVTVAEAVSSPSWRPQGRRRCRGPPTSIPNC